MDNDEASRRSVAHTLASGRVMPAVGLGTWDLRGTDAYRATRIALDLGYRHIDTATVYDNEAAIGKAIRDSGIPRDAIFVVTKLPPENAGREAATLGESLRALDMDYVDLWLIHWPLDGNVSVPCWDAFIAMRQSGRAVDVGVSNHSPAEIDRLAAATQVMPAVNQIRWSPRFFDARGLEHSRDHGYVLEGYSPFKSTFLDDGRLVEIAIAHGVTPADVILQWYKQHHVVAIPKSATAERLRSNLADRGFTLACGQMAALDAMSELRDVPH